VALRQCYPPGTGLLTESINAVKVIENKAEKALLLWGDLPAWRRDNAFIHSGYSQIRPSYVHSLRSLFNLHNESVNIWSHLLGAIVSVVSSLYLYCVIRPRYEFATPSDLLVFAFFIGGAVLCFGMSATFHALLNHSQKVARWGNKLDYTGIVVLIVGSFVPALYYGFFCMPALLTAYLCLVSLALRGLNVTLTAIDKDLDMSAWYRMRHCLVGREVPHSKMAAIPEPCCSPASAYPASSLLFTASLSMATRGSRTESALPASSSTAPCISSAQLSTWSAIPIVSHSVDGYLTD
jgi:predicted membrane channel-forming protein YqfA (hemolysin III family)